MDGRNMTISRSRQVSLDHTPYYHCTSRCVRRAFLCGNDRFSGKDYAHRRQWIEDRLAYLGKVFAIDLLAYAIMENHYHVVVRIHADKANAWSDDEVKERWGCLYPQSAQAPVEPPITLWRDRLKSLSWFMRCINEPLARYANKEDDCKGRFWEGRFKSQALLDEAALLKCMCYVDLNPVRAAIAKTPEASHYTSVKARIDGRREHLLAFNTGKHSEGNCIPMVWRDYLKLVDWTGRAISLGKRGATPAELPPILARTGIEPDYWVQEMQHYGRWYYRAVGSAHALQRYCEHLGTKWLKGATKLQLSPT
jgi:REP element-mobilizing transposase RayT